MILNMKHFVVFITILVFLSCGEEKSALSEVEGKQLPITSALAPVNTIDDFVAPYRERIDQVLDSSLAYAAKNITKDDGKYNTTAGNLMADIILEMANPVFKARTKKDIDFVVLNHGGIRSVISKGPVSARTAYEIMPFENTIAIVELTGKSVRELVSFLIEARRPQPIAGIQIVLDKNGELQSVNIGGKPFNETRSYFIATSNYLVNGGDDMGFFTHGLHVTEIDYKVRNAIIDYFKKVDTLSPVVDNRFMQLN